MTFFFFFGDTITVTNFSGKNLVPPQIGLRRTPMTGLHLDSQRTQSNILVQKGVGAITIGIIQAECPSKADVKEFVFRGHVGLSNTFSKISMAKSKFSQSQHTCKWRSACQRQCRVK